MNKCIGVNMQILSNVNRVYISLTFNELVNCSFFLPVSRQNTQNYRATRGVKVRSTY